jgi:hypothetical protein
MEWLQRTIGFLMLARDPLYAQLRHERFNGIAEATIEVGGDPHLVKATLISVTGSVDIGPAIAGDIGDLHAEVSGIADQRLEQTMRAYFALVMEVTQRTGNAVDARGDAAEGFLGMLERMDIHFDEDGKPALQMVVSPDDAERVRAQLAAFTPGQHRRFAEIISRKREAYRASRRRRRLPRHCH